MKENNEITNSPITKMLWHFPVVTGTRVVKLPGCLIQVRVLNIRSKHQDCSAGCCLGVICSSSLKGSF